MTIVRRSLGLPSLHRGCPGLPLLAVGGWQAIIFTLSPHSLLFLSLSRLRTTDLKSKTRKTAQNITRVEGRSYPPLYRAHKWAKGGWAYLRPSPFGVYVGLPNRDLHGPQKANKYNSISGSAKHKCETPIIREEEEE